MTTVACLRPIDQLAEHLPGLLLTLAPSKSAGCECKPLYQPSYLLGLFVLRLDDGPLGSVIASATQPGNPHKCVGVHVFFLQFSRHSLFINY